MFFFFFFNQWTKRFTILLYLSNAHFIYFLLFCRKIYGYLYPYIPCDHKSKNLR